MKKILSAMILFASISFAQSYYTTITNSYESPVLSVDTVGTKISIGVHNYGSDTLQVWNIKDSATVWINYIIPKGTRNFGFIIDSSKSNIIKWKAKHTETRIFYQVSQ